MSDALIASLNDQVQRLQTENAELRSEAKSRRLKGKELQATLDKHAADLAAVTKERDALKARADAEPGELQIQVDTLKGKLRDREHRDAFKRLAASAGARTEDTAIDDLWHASGYKAEADEIDDTKITAAIGKALQGRDYLKAAPPPEGGNGKPLGNGKQPALAGAAHETHPPGPGASRGATASGKGDQDARLAELYPDAFRVTRPRA